MQVKILCPCLSRFHGRGRATQGGRNMQINLDFQTLYIVLLMREESYSRLACLFCCEVFLVILLLSGVRTDALAQSPFRPFYLRVIRSEAFPVTVTASDCIQGKLYLADGPSLSDPTGVFVGDTLELPWRANLNDISAIPAGLYTGFTRDDGPRGWRIELKSVPGRDNVQVHVGNRPDDTVGCILLGQNPQKNPCRVSNSQQTMGALRSLYGSNKSRPIELVITGP